MTSNQTIINKFFSLEALALQLAKECRQARKLMEGGVSTSPDSQVIKMHVVVQKKLARRNSTMLKRSK